MTLEDAELLERFRRFPRCEFCGDRVSKTEPSHTYSVGAGRVDWAGNLTALCSRCHRSHHDGNRPKKSDLETIAALREGIQAEDIRTEVYRIRALPQPPQDRVERPLTKKTAKAPPAWKKAAQERKRSAGKALRERLKADRKALRKNPGMS
jgi:hypothetical protein